MELDEEADNVLEVVPVVTGDEEDDENANKRLKATHHRDEQYERVKQQYETIKQEVDTDLRNFTEKVLARNKEVLKQIEQLVAQQESQLREKYYFVPHCYAAQIQARPRSTQLTMTQVPLTPIDMPLTPIHMPLTPIYMPPHASTPHTTAHVTVRHNVAVHGFEEYSRPRYYAPYFEDGDAEADEETIRKYYYAPPRYFNDVATELQLFRLLMLLEDKHTSEELIAPDSLELASRVSRVPAAVIKYYFTEHRGYLQWKTQRATTHSTVMSHDEFWEWYCRQCAQFLCARHDHNNKWRPVHCARRASALNEVELHSPAPCSDTCHSTTPVGEFTRVISALQMELLRNGLIIFAKNYCQIRKCHAPKLTCAEVRDYCVTRLSDVKSLPKLAAPQTRDWKILPRKRTGDRELAAYQPCSHEGKCHKSAKCYCYAHNLHCEKYCACGELCGNRFKGCKCKHTSSATDITCAGLNCECVLHGRECDVDTCQCDPQTCGRRDLQTKQPKHLWIGASAVAGFGLFSVNRIQSGEFIGEYVGEVIPTNEAERRGLIADKIKRSYLFDTGSDLCVDSTKFGNRLKFANHSSTPNVQPKQLRVNGELRLAFYAIEDIEPNEELFINYDYADPSSKGITNERPIDVLANKGHVTLLEMQSPGDIGELMDSEDSTD